MVVTRVLVMRHGDRYSDSHDPQLTPTGLQQAQRIAELLQPEQIDGTLHAIHLSSTGLPGPGRLPQPVYLAHSLLVLRH